MVVIQGGGELLSQCEHTLRMILEAEANASASSFQHPVVDRTLQTPGYTSVHSHSDVDGFNEIGQVKLNSLDVNNDETRLIENMKDLGTKEGNFDNEKMFIGAADSLFLLQEIQ